ncbi:acetamidase/formamidase family protein [Dactylosporangium sp. NPDC006015]|uniref:acetamidase/formamidase family protein n=1 Tax=Dactylosporangium sp. NPDC006015 TaxID=3154576 RepID=UPI0033A4BEF0
MEHVLDPDDRTLHGYFSRDRPPALTVRPGDTVTFRTLDCWWSAGRYAGEPVPDRPRVPQYRDGYGHALTGPVEIEGATPGQTLEVRIDEVVPAAWGTTVAGGWPSGPNRRYHLEHDGVVHAWDLDPATMTGRNQHGHTVPLRPFMGVMGMPPAEPGEHSTIPPRAHGGNIDCKELVAGTTLLLPVPVDGALFSVGDGHAAQGDGEVSGTAIECPMDRVTLTFGLRDDFPVSGPVARTGDAWLTMGLGDTLDDAAYAALDAMFALLERLHGVRRADAVALASVAVDLRVTQIVNQVVGVHAVLRDGALTTGG